MRLTKGKIKKLLKKKNQSKKKKHTIKRLHLNKSLKPKRKVFDVSKKTFKNRQTYGGGINHEDLQQEGTIERSQQLINRIEFNKKFHAKIIKENNEIIEKQKIEEEQRKKNNQEERKDEINTMQTNSYAPVAQTKTTTVKNSSNTQEEKPIKNTELVIKAPVGEISDVRKRLQQQKGVQAILPFGLNIK